jgi:pimeloyl-ACP methyl ester carboxylesterase
LKKSPRRNVLLVHGAWHGSWCWERLIPELEERDWTPWTIDLPSTSGDPELGMLSDASAIRQRVLEIDRPCTILAHSYAGIPVAEAAGTADGVERLVYLAAHMLKPGESDGRVAEIHLFGDQPFLVPPPDDARATLFHDVPADLAAASIARLRPTSSRIVIDQQTRAAWQDIPTASIICDGDRIHATIYTERLSSWSDLVRHLASSHSPFLSHPNALAAIITEVADALPRTKDKRA